MKLTMKYTVDDIPTDLAKTALTIQDACNAAGVIHSLARAVDKLWKMPGAISTGTDWVNQHPVVWMYLNKLCDLNHGRCVEENHPNYNAWSLCEEAAKRTD
jgi:hypothetical protein